MSKVYKTTIENQGCQILSYGEFYGSMMILVSIKVLLSIILKNVNCSSTYYAWYSWVEWGGWKKKLNTYVYDQKYDKENQIAKVALVEALKTTIYILNKVLSKSIFKTPFLLWMKET